MERLIGQALSRALRDQGQAAEMSSTEIQAASHRRVEAIFRVFAANYGASIMGAHWAGTDPEKVKEFWSVKIIGFSKQALTYACMNLPSRFPPSADEFAEIAKRYRPPEPAPQLALDSPKNDEIGRQRINALAALYGTKAVSR